MNTDTKKFSTCFLLSQSRSGRSFVPGRIASTLALYGLLGLASLAAQAQVEVPNQFSSGEPAIASEVNQNFEALATALNDAVARIEVLEADNAVLQNQVTLLEESLSVVESSNVMAINNHVELIPDPYVPGAFSVRFTGVNLQVVDGQGADESSVNGLGNLIIGYNEERTSGNPVCSRSDFLMEAECLAAGGTWALNHKSGSHNLVGGETNSYSSHGGLVFGRSNTVNNSNAAVLSGAENVAGGITSSVSGGTGNTANALLSTITGGSFNETSGIGASISGGTSNVASGFASSVSGGNLNQAGGIRSSILGGSNQMTTVANEAAPPIP